MNNIFKKSYKEWVNLVCRGLDPKSKNHMRNVII